MIPVQRFVEGLRAMPSDRFTVPGVESYLRENPVDPTSLAPYLFYTPTHYTRNLIHKDERFELLAICWDVGQVSRIHNHSGQECWMAVPTGRLAVQNYRIVAGDEASGSCELQEADRLVMDPEHPAHVEREMPIHSVLNLPEYAQQATSLHVYSHPYDRCLVYSLEEKSCREVPLFYDTEYGQPTGWAPS